MKHINLFRAIPVGGAIAAAVYLAGAEISRSPTGDVMAVVLGVIVAGAFYVQIRLGHLPWFEKKDGKAHRLVVWLEKVFPGQRSPR
jgi:hypothetical protein